MRYIVQNDNSDYKNVIDSIINNKKKQLPFTPPWEGLGKAK